MLTLIEQTGSLLRSFDDDDDDWGPIILQWYMFFWLGLAKPFKVVYLEIIFLPCHSKNLVYTLTHTQTGIELQI